MKVIYQSVFIVLMLCISQLSYSQASMVRAGSGPVFMTTEHLPWVDSVFNSMSVDQRIGQLFMVAAYSNKDKAHLQSLEELVTKQHIGGLIFFKGGPMRQAKMTNYLQARAQVPLMIAMDAEWGLSMRLDITVKYPRQMMMGAINNDSIIYEMGAEIAKQCKRLGVHISFSPVIDVNNNPANPVIGNRSFGENKYKVARKGGAYMEGLQQNGVLACGKHFPGHGDTDVDSHKGLPVIDFDRARLDSLELYPFRQLMSRGLGSVMVAHLYIPQLDSTPNLASTLSPVFVKEMLQTDLGFKGLAFTDALNMKGVSKFWEPGEVDLKALMAGNDVLLFPEDVPKAIERIKQAVAEGDITMEEINQHCHKILMAKGWMGLTERKRVSLTNLYEDLNTPRAERVNQLLHDRSITLLKNDESLLPINSNYGNKYAYVSITDFLKNGFHKELKKYGEIPSFSSPLPPSGEKIQQIVHKLKDHETVIISIRKTKSSPKSNFGVTKQAMELIRAIDKDHKVILVLFGNPYALAAYEDLASLESIIITYQENALTDEAAAKLIMGKISPTGTLPVSIGDQFMVGDGVTSDLGVLEDALPEEFGISSADLMVIDSLAINGIEEGAYPGCAILVAKEGKVIYEKTFGHHTYENKREVRTSDLYDLASITKIASTAAAIIKLQEDGLMSVDDVLSQHLEEIHDTSEYKNMKIRNILTHQAGLVPWIPFYTSTLEGGRPNPELYRKAPNDIHSVQIADGMYMHHNQRDTILQRILSTKLRRKKEGKHSYKYSDLGYYLLREVIERKTGMPLEEYVQESFYDPMGLTTMGYHPLRRVDKNRVVPTEEDMYYRMQLLRGHVHDMGAAMQGGVGGHAGLFSNGRDLAAMMQMFLDGGQYANQQLLDADIINEFTACQWCDGSKEENRRGVAFDKPYRGEKDNVGPTCKCVSYESFGHSGFTGTLAWADPEEDIVYVFLSNRIYPSMDNKKLNKMNIRTNIMQAIYDAVDKGRDSDAYPDSLDMGEFSE